MTNRWQILALCLLGGILACESEESEPMQTFGDDLTFLQQSRDVTLLQNALGDRQVAIVGEFQGRVMTSSFAGEGGPSLGWLNYELIGADTILPHINAYGGEERFWLGPEGGQYAIFFKKGASFTLEDWQTPSQIDTDPFDLVSASSSEAVFETEMELENYSGTDFKLLVNRRIRLLEEPDVSAILGARPASTVQWVGYRSDNRITNTGEQKWRKSDGLLSIWILGMFPPSPVTTVVVPFRAGPENELGPVVNDSYFGKVPADRLVVQDSTIYFSGDGAFRSKIGLSPARSKPIIGSYDAEKQRLTIVKFSLDPAAADYVNSMWEIQEHPYAGDVINSYNDGPPEPGAKQLGPFYELETSSPAKELAPGESLQHSSTTVHFQGSPELLDMIARATLGVDLATITSALGKE